MTATMVEHHLETYLINVRLPAAPGNMPPGALMAVVKGVSDALALALVVAPGSGFEPGLRSRGAKGGIDGLPFPPTTENLDAARTWPAHEIEVWWELDKWEPEDWNQRSNRGYPDGVAFSGHNVSVYFQKPENALEAASWLSPIKRLSYGSPLEIDFLVVAVQTIPIFVTGFLAYMFGGRAQKRKVLGEAAQLEIAASLAEAQKPHLMQRLKAEVSLAEAQALAVQSDASLKAAEADKIRLENIRNRLALLKDVEEYLAKQGTSAWTPEQLWSFLGSPGLSDSLDQLGDYSPALEVVSEESA